MKVLYLLRGVPGSGKTFAAETLGCPVFSADDFFMVDGEYQFNPDNLPQAHNACFSSVDRAMYAGESRIAVANTFTREWEMKNYFYIASVYGYTVISLIVENRHDGKNSHGVPEDKVQEMRERFEVKL